MQPDKQQPEELTSLRTSIINALNQLALVLERSRGYAQATATELVLHLAGPEQLSRFTGDAYNRNPIYLDGSKQYLFEWEAAIVTEFFPPSPSKVLVGACGGGREMIGLAKLGYDVAGFDPGADLIALAREEVPAERLLELALGSYEELMIRRASASAHAPYDALILGWGSLSHLSSAKTRHDLLLQAREVSPLGPIVLSWVRDGPGEPELAVRERLAALGFTTRDVRECYSMIGGYSRTYSHEEIFSLAADTGNRVLRYEEGDYPHAVFGPIA
jgi:2-polyprenyl-3-methyl-5-hydroxy-6-metoxy-1,4-benzoquinol methylase